MALVIFYEDDPDGGSSDISGHIRKLSLDVTQNAEEGSTAMSSIIIDDPLGELDIVGWRRIRISEDAESEGYTLLYNGWVAAKDVSRGPYRTQVGRQWATSMVDMNAIIDMRVMQDFDRPAETDIERLDALLATNEASRITDTTYYNTSSPKNMDANDYTGQLVSNVIEDCAQQSGKNYFIWTKDNGVGNSLDLSFFYDKAGSPVYDADIAFSNVISDVDNETIFFMSLDAVLTRDPSRVYSGAFDRYDGGSVYVEDTTTRAIFTRRDAVYDSPNVHTSTKATARATRYLEDTDTEEDRIVFGAYLPRNKVNHAREGQRIGIRATHLPGYEELSLKRCLQRKVLEVSEGDEAAYLVTYEISGVPLKPVVPLGEGSLYLTADNAVNEMYVNGNLIEAGSLDHDTPVTIAEGYLHVGDNVLAAKIENGVGSEYWWGGNGTMFEARVLDGLSNVLAYTDATAKVLPLQNYHGGTLNAEPSGWQEASFDDSGWATAEDVTGSLNSLAAPMFVDPVSPARTIAPPGAKVEAFTDPSYAYLLVWLVRINFTA